MPRTTTATLADTLASAEADYLAGVRQRDADRVELEAQKVLASAALDEAKDVADSLRRGVRTGTAGYDAEAFAKADANLEATELAFEGISSRLAALAGKPAVVFKDLAELVAVVLRDALPGVPVYTTLVTPPDVTDSDTPVAFVTANDNPTSKTVTAKVDGFVSGQTEVLYRRSIIHRPLDLATINRAAQRAGYNFRVTDRGHSDDGVGFDRFIITVIDSAPPVPVIPITEPVVADSVAANFGAELSRSRGRHVYLAGSSARVVSESVADGGIRTTIVETVATLKGSRIPQGPTAAGTFGIITGGDTGSSLYSGGSESGDSRTAQQIADAMVGSMFANLGRVTAAKVASDSAPSGDEKTSTTVQFTLTSRDSYITA